MSQRHGDSRLGPMLCPSPPVLQGRKESWRLAIMSGSYWTLPVFRLLKTQESEQSLCLRSVPNKPTAFVSSKKTSEQAGALGAPVKLLPKI